MKFFKVALVIATMLIPMTQLVTGITVDGLAAPTSFLPTSNQSGGFINSSVVTFVYTGNYTCTPRNSSGDGYTYCEVGSGGDSTGALPLWIIIPAYSGLSIFGAGSLGATSQGFPVFMNQTVYTNCGAGGTQSACADHPTYLYSSAFTAVEKKLGINNGTFGLPEGVLPTPAHSHIIVDDNKGKTISWYIIAVLVFDPNIFPNASTGRCSATVAGDLSNVTGNCLNSLAAIQRAIATRDSAVSTANRGNPVWSVLTDNSTIQAIVPGYTLVTPIQFPNTNLAIPFYVTHEDFYAQSTASTTSLVPTTSIQTTVPPSQTGGAGYSSTTVIEVVIVIAVIAVIVWLGVKGMKQGKKK